MEESANMALLTRKAYNRSGFASCLLYLAMSVVSSLVMVALIVPFVLVSFMKDPPVAVFDALRSGDIGGYISGILEYVNSLMGSGSAGLVIMLAVVLGTALGMAAGIPFFRLMLRKVPSSPIEKRYPGAGRIAYYAVTALGCWAIGALFGNIPSFIGLRGATEGFLESFSDHMLPYYIYAIIGAPFFEELIFRKFLLDRIHGYGELPAAVVSGILFGLIHGNSAQFFLAFCCGFMFAVIYMKTGRIIITMLLHATINSIATVPDIVLLFTKNGGGESSFSPTVFILAVMAVLAVAAALVNLIGRKKIRESGALVLTLPESREAAAGVFRNPGMLIFIILMSAQILLMDFFSLFLNLDRKALALVCLIPAAAFAVFLAFVMKSTSQKWRAPAATADTEPVQDADASPEERQNGL